MEPIRVVWGTGRGPTALAAYDAALADAGVHDYNLLHLSSVIPAGAAIEVAGEAPDLGPPGEGLHVVEASATGRGGPQSAVLAWARSPSGPGLFYEAGESAPLASVQEEVLEGLEAGVELRDRPYGEPETHAATVDAAESPGHAAAVVLAAYGASDAVVDG